MQSQWGTNNHIEFNDPSIIEVRKQETKNNQAEQKKPVRKGNPGMDSLTKWAVNHVKKLDEKVNLGLDGKFLRT